MLNRELSEKVQRVELHLLFEGGAAKGDPACAGEGAGPGWGGGGRGWDEVAGEVAGDDGDGVVPGEKGGDGEGGYSGKKRSLVGLVGDTGCGGGGGGGGGCRGDWEGEVEGEENLGEVESE